MIKLLQFLFLLSTLLFSKAWAYLEVDETLTVRVLRLSDSKKTALVNRGLEDGLVVDMHAKFYLTTGVIARGMVVKASPSRSIWSLYRIIEEGQLVEDRVMNIKVSTPMMLTEDPAAKPIRLVDPVAASRQRSRTSSPSSNVEIVSDGSLDGLSDDEQAELASMSASERPASWSPREGSSLVSRDWELWSLLQLNMLSGTFEEGDTTGTVSQSNVDFSLGLEKYFPSSNSLLNTLSVSLLLHLRSSESGDAVAVKSSWVEYGVAANYHFYGDHLKSDNLIGLVSLGLGVGSVTSGTATQETGDIEAAETSLSGSSSFFSLGVGGKYYLANGFGMRAMVDFYRTSESYTFEDENTLSRSLSGPRMQFGLSYRW